MRAFLVLMSFVNVGLAAISGFVVAKAPFMYDTGGAGDGVLFSSFAVVIGIPIFCLIASALPHFLLSRGKPGAARLLALIPSAVAAGLYVWLRSMGQV